MEYSIDVSKEEFSVAMPSHLHKQLSIHLLRGDKQEEVAFALYKPSQGAHRTTALIHEVIFPKDGDRNVHGNVDIHPQYFKRVCALAMENGSGIILLHSHTGPGWQGMSIDDIKTELSYSRPTLTLSDLPFVGLTLGTDETWSARIWQYNNGWFDRKTATSVRVVGKRLVTHFNDLLRPKPLWKEIYKRTITVWGEEHHGNIARLKIGIVGLGSVGSMVVEALARMGVERFVLIDFDEVQNHNLDRLIGTTTSDIGQLKVLISHRQVLRSSTASYVQVQPIPHGVTEDEGYRRALDCDVIFSCVDRPWARHVLNHIAYNHLIPVIDGGIRVKFNEHTGLFAGADWQATAVGPERICLSCIGQYHSAHVSTEKDGLLENPSYMVGLPDDHQLKKNENVFPFSMNLASMEILQFVEMVTGIGRAEYYGLQRYVYNQGIIRLKDEEECINGCEFAKGIALGDTLFEPPIGFDHAAHAARKRQSNIV